MYQEADNVHIVAISNAFGIDINVANLDGSAGNLNYHEFSPMIPPANESEKPPPVTLLYRPGHYDILYKTSKS